MSHPAMPLESVLSMTVPERLCRAIANRLTNNIAKVMEILFLMAMVF